MSERKHRTTTIDPDIWSAFKEWCQEHGTYMNEELEKLMVAKMELATDSE